MTSRLRKGSDTVWEILPSVDEELLQMDALIAVGLGDAGAYRDGEIVYDGNAEMDMNKELRVEEVERAAAADPDHDWTIVWNGPLAYEKYQRQGEKCWRCVERGEGFA
jgi:hypothetical protein